VVSSTPRPHLTPGNDSVPILQQAGWAPGPVWTSGKSRPHRDSIPVRPARSSVAIPTELPGPLSYVGIYRNSQAFSDFRVSNCTLFFFSSVIFCLEKEGRGGGHRPYAVLLIFLVVYRLYRLLFFVKNISWVLYF